ncbi:hypothetical protein ACEQPO_20945 [Bacillus sp. SL00103]
MARNFHEERYSYSKFSEQPDFVKLSEAVLKGNQNLIRRRGERKFEEALTSREPVFIDVNVARDEKVFPMVAPGKDFMRWWG